MDLITDSNSNVDDEQDVFKESKGGFAIFSSCTKQTKVHCISDFSGSKRDLYLVDTPGLFDTSKSFDEEELKGAVRDDAVELWKILMEGFKSVNSRVDAFLFDQDGSQRLSLEAQQMFEEITKMNLPWKNTALVFTHGAALGDSDQSRQKGLQEFMKSDDSPDCFKKFVKLIENKIMIVESTERGGEHHQEIYDQIHGIISKSNSPFNEEDYQVLLKDLISKVEKEREDRAVTKERAAKVPQLSAQVDTEEKDLTEITAEVTEGQEKLSNLTKDNQLKDSEIKQTQRNIQEAEFKILKEKNKLLEQENTLLKLKLKDENQRPSICLVM